MKRSLRTRLFTQQASMPVVGAIVDSGQLAQLAVAGGADFLMALPVAPFRQRGVSALGAFLPFVGANDATWRQVETQLAPWAHVCPLPLVAGVLAGDPQWPVDVVIERAKRWGVAGLTNYPTVTLTDGRLRQIFESQGTTLEAEAELLRAALTAGLAAVGFVGDDPEAAEHLAELPLDALVISAGLTTELTDVVDRRDRLERVVTAVHTVVNRARRVRRDLPCFLFGGPVTSAEDFEIVLRHAALDGIVGGSVFSRLPIEKAVTAAVRRFKSVRAARDETAFGALIGASRAMRQLYRLLERAAECDFTVCIEGESGTGKELAATQIHRLSRRQHGPLVTLNCGAIPESLLESELFGHERGAFTGAERRRLGKFELADGGTLFLDEVADLSPRAQVALLRAIQQREVTRVGADAPREVDCRIICATNQPLARLVQAGEFRADLYYRLNELTVRMPPLRERLDDLPLLIEPILASLRVQSRRPLSGISASFLEKLSRHSWPGNVRELQHVLYQAAFLEEDAVLSGAAFEPTAATAPLFSSEVAAASLSSGAASRRERALAAVRTAGGNKRRAAERLGVSRKTLYAWLAESPPAERPLGEGES
ncbi:MAG: sigma 54-interacting transcriptional regulator [Pirellulales bacterium]